MRSQQADNGDILFLAIMILLGAVLRLDFLLFGNLVLDADEAIVGLMALHYTEGRPLPVFYYGQHYMGTLEPWIAGIFFQFFGVHATVLKLVPFTFSLFLIAINFSLGRELAGSVGARISGLLTAIAPAALVVWSLKARGGFMEVLVLGGLALLLTCRWLKAERGDCSRLFLITLLLGVGWWTNNQIIFYILPIALLCTLKSIHRSRSLLATLREAGVATVGFLLGGAPFWLYNLAHDAASFRQLGGGGLGDVSSNIAGLFSTALPILLGAKRFWQEHELYAGATLVVLSLYGIVFLAATWFAARGVLRNGWQESSSLLLLIFTCSVAGVFVLSSFGYLSSAPRYLLPLYSAIAPLTAYSIVHLAYRKRPLAILCVVVFASLNILSCYLGQRAIPGEPHIFEGQRVSRDHTELLRFLDEREIRWIQTNYWIGYRIAFETQEQVRFVVFQEPYQIRIREYEQLAPKERETIPYVLVPAQAKIVERALQLQGISFRRVVSGDYVVLFDLKQERSKEQQISQRITVSASSRSGEARAAIDGDEATRWGSGEPQHPEMIFELRFEEPRVVSSLEYSLGRFTHDFPRDLRVEIENIQGEREIITDEDGFRAIRYLDSDGPWRILFPSPISVKSIRLKQTSRDSVFDWSIAELELFEPKERGRPLSEPDVP